MKEEKDPADETAFMWNIKKLEELEKECEKHDSREPTVYLDRIKLVPSYARALLEYFKKLCRSK